MDVQTIFGSVAFSTIAVGALGFLFRSWISERLKGAIQSEYDMKLEVHKTELKAQSDVAIEKLKADLSIKANERNVQFQMLHEKRAEILAELYDKLLEYMDATESLVHPVTFSDDSSQSDKWDFLEEAAMTFRKFYRHNRIVLSPVVCEKIDELWSKTWFSSQEYFFAIQDEDREELFATRKAAWRVLSRESPALLAELEREFRVILGVKTVE